MGLILCLYRRWFDNNYSDSRIKSVKETDSTFCLIYGDGWAFDLPKKYGVLPRQGQLARRYGEKGQPVRGIFLDGEEVFYRTPFRRQLFRLWLWLKG